MVGKTRNEKESLGEKIIAIEKYPAVGYKVLDIELLQDVLEKVVICRHCTSKKINILQQPSMRTGVAEYLILQQVPR